MITCKKCNGTGRTTEFPKTAHTSRCVECQGTGYAKSEFVQHADYLETTMRQQREILDYILATFTIPQNVVMFEKFDFANSDVAKNTLKQFTQEVVERIKSIQYKD